MIAVAAALVMFALALTDRSGSQFAVVVMIAAAVITVLDNGLAFRAIPEFTGPSWSGRAMGAQNTTQRLTTAAGPPTFGELIDVAGYPLAFAVCGLLALPAPPLVPLGARPHAPPVTALSRSDRRAE